MVAVEHNILSFQIALLNCGRHCFNWQIVCTTLVGVPSRECWWQRFFSSVKDKGACILLVHYFLSLWEKLTLSDSLANSPSGKINGPVSVFARLPYFEKTIPHANPLLPTYELSHLILVFCLKPRLPLRVFLAEFLC